MVDHPYTNGTAVIPKKWWASGSIFKDRMVCQYARAGTSHGLWVGHNPLDYPTPLCLGQIILIFVSTRLINLVLLPLRQSMIVAQAGILIGRSLLCHEPKLENMLFPPPGRYILKTLSTFGFMIHLFILGVKIDMSSLRNSGIKSLVVGFSGLFSTILFGALAFFVVRQLVELEQTQYAGIRVLILFNALTFFMVTNTYVHDLKLSNSDMGRLAASSSLVVDAFGLFASVIALIALAPRNDNVNVLPTYICLLYTGLYYLVLFAVLRPLVLYIVSRTEGSRMKQTHFVLIIVILLVAWLGGEYVGQRFHTFLFGLSLPDGPPLGSELVQKLEAVTSGVLLPVFCTMNGWRVNVQSLKKRTSVWAVELIFVIGHLGKFIGTFVSSIVLGVSIENAAPLALMMSLKGVVEISLYSIWKDHAVLDDPLFTLSMLNIVLFNGLAYPLIRQMYDPSAKYKTIKKRGLMGCSDNGELQILVCIHKQENVPPLVNLVEMMSKFNRAIGYISVFALQLIQLTGSAMPILAPIQKHNKSPGNLNDVNHTVNAFQQFEDQKQGYVTVQHFVSVAPYKTMHNDVCALAHDKRISIIILPFHKEWGVDGKVDTNCAQIKAVNIRVLRKAPCSVAILVDKGAGTSRGLYFNMTSNASPSVYQVVMLFIGGNDDHEALALARRIGEHPNVKLTVIWLKSNDYQPHLHDPQEDVRVMRDFHMRSIGREGIVCREKVVEDGIGTTKVVLSMQHANLFIVGRYHEPDCPAVLGLTDWSESSEVGTLGDMLATSDDFRFSILVVQQQPRIDKNIHGSRSRDDYDTLSISSDQSFISHAHSRSHFL
ncbi:hypothetical protein Cgig2_023962 [Carnegiea gigantea]|uniref:Cation/H+ exchanger domain-containing protein n=1 Tax=Carnegiea gigantea TaxID=171969 RepID=A0A9Q1KBH7_9CARY|nr:hypothetical protein Cgig2_023962 [Carnegiea gigantea]